MIILPPFNNKIGHYKLVTFLNKKMDLIVEVLFFNLIKYIKNIYL